MRTLFPSIWLCIVISQFASGETNWLLREAIASGQTNWLSREAIEEIELFQNPVDFPITGMTPTDLAALLLEIAPLLSENSKVIRLDFTGPERVIITTGKRTGPAQGFGEKIRLEKKDGKWIQAHKRPWSS